MSAMPVEVDDGPQFLSKLIEPNTTNHSPFNRKSALSRARLEISTQLNVHLRDIFSSFLAFGGKVWWPLLWWPSYKTQVKP